MTALIEEAKSVGRNEVLQLRRSMSLLKQDMEKKEIELHSMASDLQWSKVRLF